MGTESLTVTGLLVTSNAALLSAVLYLFRELRKETRARAANAELFLRVLRKQRGLNLNDSEPPPSNSSGMTNLLR